MLKTNSFAIVKKVIRLEHLGPWNSLKDWLFALVVNTPRVAYDADTVLACDSLALSREQTHPLNIAKIICIVKLISFLEKCHELQIRTKELKRLTTERVMLTAQGKEATNLPKITQDHQKAKLSLLKATIEQQKFAQQVEKKQILAYLEDVYDTAFLVKSAEEANAEMVTFPKTRTIN